MKIFKRTLSLLIVVTFIAMSVVSAYAQNITVDDDFSDNTVIIVLTPDESKKNPVLTPEDFKSLGVIKVERLSYDGATNHIYALTLNKNDKQNVLSVISELQKIEWIYAAEPNYSSNPDDNKVEVTKALLKAINTYHGVNVSKEDVSLEYMFMLEEHEYVVRYRISGFMYTCDMVELRMGEFLLTTPRPVPMIYKSGKLYEFEDAYNKGYLSEFDMHALVSFDDIDMRKVEDICGDANYDGKFNILDATYIQRYKAGLIEESEINIELSDFDNDGMVSVLDATAIQLRLAELY